MRSAIVAAIASLTLAGGAAADPAGALPRDFPAVGAPAVSGKLVTKTFRVAKAVLRTRVDGSSLDLYNWSDGGPCEPQAASEPDQLYVTALFPSARLAVGAPIASTDDHVFVIYKKPDLGVVNESSWTVFDTLGRDRAKGRILLIGPDGTRVAGSFDAAVCASPDQPRAAPAPIHGLAWGTRDVAPGALPKQTVRGMLLGKLGAPVAIEVVDWKGDIAEQHEVHFFFTPPERACAFGQSTPGFTIGFGRTIAAGVSARGEVATSHGPANPFAAVLWEEPGNVVGLEGRGWLSASIDAVDADKVTGRVFAWFEDASKSMLVGGFTAKRCHIKP